MADEAAVAAMFDTAEQAFGGIDLVVHSAGIMPLAPLADLDLDVLDRVLRTNLRGTFVVAQQAVRRVRPGCAIIKFSSSVLGLALPNYSAYAASKGGVEAITLIVARELLGREVTINAIAPGPTATPLFLNGKDEETIERFASQPPLERLGIPLRHRRGRCLPCRARPLGQRPGIARQRWHRLTPHMDDTRSTEDEMSKTIVISGAASGFGPQRPRPRRRWTHRVRRHARKHRAQRASGGGRPSVRD